MAGEKLKQRGVAQVLFQVCALAQILRINLRHRQDRGGESAWRIRGTPRSLPVNVIEDADGAEAVIGKADDGAFRSAQSALHRIHPQGGGVKVLLE